VSPILCSDSTFLHLDATAWTALAVIVALALGLYGAFGEALASWISKPILRLEVERLAKHSELSNDCRQFASTAQRQSVSVSVLSEYLNKKLPLSDYIDVRPA